MGQGSFMFKVNPQFEKDSVYLEKLTVSQLRLMKDGDIDWFLLVPEKEGTIEVTDLTPEEQLSLHKEMMWVATLLKQAFPQKKINIGALGNVVQDLHIHILLREEGDRAWPGPIWGSSTQKKFNEEKIHFWHSKVKENLHLLR